MKKTMKRYLSLLLAVMMVLTSFSFAVAAADNCAHQIAYGDPNYRKVVNPTCDSQGYTIYYCTKCSTAENKVEAMVGDYTESLGHKYEKFDFVEVKDENGKVSYRKVFDCVRVYVQNGQKVECESTYVETDNGEEVVYYLVDFFNNKVTASYDETIDYTNVVDEYKSVHLGYTYVRAGEEAVYSGDKPYREKTKDYAAYAHIGWTTDSDLEKTIGKNPGAENCFDISAVNDNLVLYAVFEGLTEDSYGTITHNVTFHKFDDNNIIVPITVNQDIAHGGTPKYSNPDNKLYDPPEKSETIAATYKFKGWSTKAYKPYSTNLIANEDIENFKVYGDVNFYPVYNEIAKNYVVKFYDPQGENVIKYKENGVNKEAVFENINVGKDLVGDYDAINSFIKHTESFAKPEDKDYIYIWNGQWAILNPNGSIGRTVNIRRFNLYEGEYNIAVDADGNPIVDETTGEVKKVVMILPVFEKKRQLYAVDIEMIVPTGEDTDYNRFGADVHVVDKNNQLVASGLTDENGKFRCYLYNNVPLTVTIATSDDKYIGTAQITSLEKAFNGTQDDEANLNLKRVQMSLNPEYETHCLCIHHNALLQPIFVRILNILYNLFNVKYVCCYDMYSTIGPLLEYTA